MISAGTTSNRWHHGNKAHIYRVANRQTTWSVCVIFSCCSTSSTWECLRLRVRMIRWKLSWTRRFTLWTSCWWRQRRRETSQRWRSCWEQVRSMMSEMAREGPLWRGQPATRSSNSSFSSPCADYELSIHKSRSRDLFFLLLLSQLTHLISCQLQLFVHLTAS